MSKKVWKRLVAFGLVGGLSLLLVGAGPTADPLREMARGLFGPLPKVAENPQNPATTAKVELGRALYHDPRLSLSGFISCNSCHNLASYGVDNLSTSIGHRWALGPRNAPTVYNAALHAVQFWDGRAKDVEEQAKGPVLNPIEMAIPHQAFAVERIASIPGYQEMFRKAFPKEANPITYDNIAKAIAAFERTLITPTRFHKWLEGDDKALSPLEKEGLQVFINYGCAGCHQGPALGGTMMTRFGVVEAYWEATRPYVTLDRPTMPMDVGRFAVTKNPDDLYVFKVPSLINITRTYPYFHDGSIWSLEVATQVMAKVQLGREIPEEDLRKLMAFYRALDGEIPAHALRLPVLPPSGPKTAPPQP